MTAEIAVMNKSAVAFAADSAVTIQMDSGHKIYTTNKLFTLSKYHPVGIMIYGKANILKVPWETVIKLYRKALGNQSFPTLEGYHDDFLKFLEKSADIFPKDCQEDYFRHGLSSYFQMIKKKIGKKVKSFTEKEKITLPKIRQLANLVIREKHEYLKTLDYLPDFTAANKNSIIKKYSNLIHKIKKDVFLKLPISPSAMKNLNQIAGHLFSKGIFQNNLSGVVIGGFGTKEIYPCVKSFEIEGIAANKAKYKIAKSVRIDQTNDASIIPFAQAEMVSTFMEGVDPDYHESLFKGLTSMLREKYPEYIIGQIQGMSEKKKKTLASQLEKIGEGVLKEFSKQLHEYSFVKHVSPIISAVSVLPKEELAVMAETLVNLTSFKRKVSIDSAETVGGPIDVAVISKGDGFVWIKRKHYFDQKLNPHFLANYFGEHVDNKEMNHGKRKKK